jgi:hypothetical protein
LTLPLPKSTSPMLTTDSTNTSPLPPSPRPAMHSFTPSSPSPLAQITLPENTTKLVDLPSPSSYPSERYSSSTRFESKTATEPALSDSGDSSDGDELQGVTFNFGPMSRNRVKQNGIRASGQADQGDLMEFSAPSVGRGIIGVAVGERIDVIGTPGKAEEVLKGLVGTPGERRRALSSKDVNET